MCKLVSQFPDLLADSYREFTDIKAFLAYLIDLDTEVGELLSNDVGMNLTAEEEELAEYATHCHICSKELFEVRARDHCHLTGKFRGAAHIKCNLEYNYKHWKLPVFFHNLKGYDPHFIFQEIGAHSLRRIASFQ